jgi:hypothetical protein
VADIVLQDSRVERQLMGSSCFRDIKAGRSGAFRAGPGYDLFRGIGVPNGRKVLAIATAQLEIWSGVNLRTAQFSRTSSQ